MAGLASIAIFAAGGAFGASAAVSVSHDQQHQYVDAYLLRLASAPVARASTTSTTATPSTPARATLAATPASPATSAAPASAPAPVPASAPAPAAAAPAAATPAFGQATAWGCTAALAYLQAYAAPGFALDCPGYAEGHEAMTCLHGTPEYPDACPNGPTIAISDPCPQAYMNETANSWLMTGQLSTEQQRFGTSYASIDPFGACP